MMEQDRGRDARVREARMQELLQSGLTLGSMSCSAPPPPPPPPVIENRVGDALFTLGNPIMAARYAQGIQQATYTQPQVQYSPQTHLKNTYKAAQSVQHQSNQQISSLQQPGSYANGMNSESVEVDRVALSDRAGSTKATPSDRALPSDSSSAKENGSFPATEKQRIDSDGKRKILVESKRSASLGSGAESKDSVRSVRGLEGGGEMESQNPQSQSSGRTTRECVFADLNAEPPASDGEDAGPLPVDGALMSIQAESSRTTTTEDKKRRKKASPKLLKDGEEVDNKKVVKIVKSRAKPKGETVDSGLEGENDHHFKGVPTTKEEKIKSLKAGLQHVAKKLPKNAHAHFLLGLMHQRARQYIKATQAFRQAADVLRQSEEETGQGRAQFLALVQAHQAMCVLQTVIGGQVQDGKELHKDEIDSVVGKLREAIQVDVGQALVWSALGLLLLQQGKVQSSISVLTSLLEVDPEHADALANLGVAYLQSGQLQNAGRCFQMVLERDKSHPGALINYSVLLLRQYCSSIAGAGAGAGPEAYESRLTAAAAAQKCLEAALKEDPKAGHVWANLAAAYTALGSRRPASLCLEQAAKLEPARLATRFAVAAHRVRDAEVCEEPFMQLNWAANEMASIIREGEPGTLQPRLAWAGLAMVNRAQLEIATCEGGGDPQELKERAFLTLQQAIEEDPGDAVQWHQLGVHALCTLDFGPAQDYLKTAIARRRSSPTAWSNLGIAIQLSEDPSEAEKVYKQALNLAAPEQAHTVLSNLGNLYRQQRRFAEAHEVFKKALELCPEYAPACNNLGLLLVAEGRWVDAIATFERALQSDPYLDAAKSNKVKAKALAEMKGVSLADESPTSNSRPLS